MKERFYTDGACSENPGPGGWASILVLPHGLAVESGFEPNTTNNRMELTAVCKTLNRICNMTDEESARCNEYEVYSDSAYVVNAINNNWLSKWRLNNWKTSKGDDVKNKDLWVLCLNNLSVLRNRNCCIKFIKVKGHSGDTLNEYADEVAKLEIRNGITKNHGG